MALTSKWQIKTSITPNESFELYIQNFIHPTFKLEFENILKTLKIIES